MFLGTFTPRLDDKGRFFLPAKHRDAFTTGLVLAPGQEHSVQLFTPEQYELESDALLADPVQDADARAYMRMWGALSSEEVPDKQGRVSISAKLRDWARLDKDIAVVGAFKCLEIWDLETWDTYEGTHRESLATRGGRLQGRRGGGA